VRFGRISGGIPCGVLSGHRGRLARACAAQAEKCNLRVQQSRFSWPCYLITYENEERSIGEEEMTQLGELLAKIVVEPPGPKSRQLAERLIRHESPTASGIREGEIPVFWERSQGANVVDVDGNLYVDMVGGFAVAVAGHSNPRIVEAISQQSEKLLHSMGVVHPNVPRVELAEKLAEIAPGDLTVSHIANTGSESVGIALKTARLYTGRHTVVAFQGGYHGRTWGALTVTSLNYAREPWQPLLVGSVHVPYAYCYRCPFERSYPDCDVFCAKYLEYVLGFPHSAVTDVAAVIAEPVLGVGGWVVPPPEFLNRVVKICHERGILFIADEIITGFGRTGRLFGIEHSNVVPDIMVLGKGLASGFPISAAIMTKDVADSWRSKQHTSTFLGHPVGCAAALACIGEIEDKGLVQRSKELGKYFTGALEAMKDRHPLLGDVRGLGLMVAIELVKDKQTKEPASGAVTQQVIAAALRRGLMATLRGGAYGNCIRMAPSLTITREQLEFAVRSLDESLTDVELLL
jgi:4-aminobutyrate aminotransferase